ncbi:histidine kinase [Streptomyces sp. GZWMJZ-114]|uniref:sensor histidine kinase n=1 Tax=Streptomyces sp. GZWMJZ-114 TaxID=2494734 RepID=UPI001011346A|nr:histidine kinase [Streptomyces sp. GZWMJZ-114]
MAVTALSHGVRALGLWAVLAVPVVLARPLGLVEHVPWGATAAGLVALALAAACARHLPATALLLAAAPGLAFGTALFTADYGFALPVLAYLLGLRGGARQTTAACAALALGGSARVLWRAEDPVTAWLLLLAVLLFLVVFPWLAGRYRLQRRALAEAGWARAARLEEEQRGVAERAALRERARIAAEMHDALGHELSLLALRAGTLQVAADLPERHREAAAGLRAATADAVDRLHEIVGVLRAEEAEPGPAENDPPPEPPPAPDLHHLLGRTVASGLAVRVTAWPERPDAHTALRHRVVREALTNAARYAPGAEVTVACVPGDGGTHLRIASGVRPGLGSGAGAKGGSGAGSVGGAREAGARGAGAGSLGGLGAGAASGRGAEGSASGSRPVSVSGLGVGSVSGLLGAAPAGGPDTEAVGGSATEAVGGPGPGRPTVRPPSPLAPKGGGSGLRALAGAVRAAGGRFGAGPREEGGHLVEVWLPAQRPDLLPTGAWRRLRGRRLFGRPFQPFARSPLPAGGAPPATGPAVGTWPGVAAGRPLLAGRAFDAGPAVSATGPVSVTAPVAATGPVFGPGRLRVLVVAGVVAGAVLLGGGFGWYAYSRSHSVLDARVYTDARLGTPYADLAPRLPARTVGDVPVEREPARPAGAACRYYRAVPGLFVSVDHYRLCFRDGRLVDKTVVPGAGAVGDARRELGELGG